MRRTRFPNEEGIGPLREFRLMSLWCIVGQNRTLWKCSKVQTNKSNFLNFQSHQEWSHWTSWNTYLYRDISNKTVECFFQRLYIWFKLIIFPRIVGIGPLREFEYKNLKDIFSAEIFFSIFLHSLTIRPYIVCKLAIISKVVGMEPVREFLTISLSTKN